MYVHRLNSPNVKHHDYVNVWEESNNLDRTRSQEHLASNPQVPVTSVRESLTNENGNQDLDNANPDVVYDELNSSDEDVGNFSRHSITRQSIRSDSGRNVQFTRQSDSRMSVRSETGIGHRIHHDSDGDGRLSRRRPGSLNTHSGIGVKVHRGSTDPALIIPTGGSRDDFENSALGMQPLSIHQVQTPKQHQEIASIFVSPLGDVPGFKDPEILGGGSDSLEKLQINLPPDIYSSQILSTVKSHEAENVEDELDEFFDRPSGPMIITETKKSTQSLDRYISLEPGKLL